MPAVALASLAIVAAALVTALTGAAGAWQRAARLRTRVRSLADHPIAVKARALPIVLAPFFDLGERLTEISARVERTKAATRQVEAAIRRLDLVARCAEEQFEELSRLVRAVRRSK